jgi:hypothetical protein
MIFPIFTYYKSAHIEDALNDFFQFLRTIRVVTFRGALNDLFPNFYVLSVFNYLVGSPDLHTY